jgi:hypothetical protein
MPRRQALDRRKHGTQVGLDDRIPVLVLHAHQQVVAGDAGIVDQDGRRAELLDHGLPTLHRGGIGDVQHHARALDAGLPQVGT